MRIKPLPLIVGIMALFLYSCDIFIGGGGGYDGQSRIFRAQNTVTGNYYNVPAKLLYVGEKCNIWGEIASHVSQSTAHDMAVAYDEIIYPRMMEAFNSGETFTEGDRVLQDPMELADYYGDGDGKLLILLLDIKDDYNKITNKSYVAGYFDPNNLYSRKSFLNSNECDMIYVDTNPGVPGSDQSNGTLAHEMQHLMNFAITLAKRAQRNSNNQITSLNQMDTWIDEGLSTAAEWVWNGTQAQDRVDWYGNDPTDWIKKGNNFYVWGNHTSGAGGDTDAVLDDYATDYLFFQWIRLQAGDTDIYKKIIYSTLSDYRAVTTAAGQAISSDYSTNWSLLLRDWLAANYINAPSGIYGYKNDPTLSQIGARFLSGSAGKDYSLAPGEGIYTQKTSMPTATANIKYAGLPARGSGAGPNDTSASGSSALLSYNTDTNTSKYSSSSPCNPFSTETVQSQEIQSDTGVSMASRSMSQGQRWRPSGPFPISAGDVFRRNGGEGLPGVDLPKLLHGGNETDE